MNQKFRGRNFRRSPRRFLAAPPLLGACRLLLELGMFLLGLLCPGRQLLHNEASSCCVPRGGSRDEALLGGRAQVMVARERRAARTCFPPPSAQPQRAIEGAAPGTSPPQTGRTNEEEAAARPHAQVPHRRATMASRLLHRLRHALTGEGDQEGVAGSSPEAEEFPESSELEDDTEGLSTRLSGTLSFTSNDEEEEDEDDNDDTCVAEQELGEPLDPVLLGDATEIGERSSPLAEQRGSNMLTRQLQELWRKSRGSLVPQRLLFEVTNASVVSERSSKYVLYTIYLIWAGRFDKAPAAISRRYSDFERLNRHLRRRFGSDMADVSFPRKRLRRNFAAETIAKRSRAFEQFLSHLHSLPEIRRSTDYLEFFFLNDLQGAQRLTCTGMYREALEAWTNAHRLQEKLGACRSGHFLLTLAGLAICHQELDQFCEAHAYCEQALQLLEAQDSHPLLAPFLQAHVHLSWMLGKDKRHAEARLQGLQEAGLAGLQPPTLKELLIKQPLP